MSSPASPSICAPTAPPRSPAPIYRWTAAGRPNRLRVVNRALAVLFCFVIAACAPQPGGRRHATAGRAAGTEHDRERLHDWRATFVKALSQARAAGHAGEIDAEGVVLQHDA